VNPHPLREFWRTRWLELAGSTVFLAFVAWPLLRPSRVVLGFDTYAYSAPNEAVSFRALTSGRLPQWNPTIFGGVAHLANPQVGLFNPLKLPFIGMDPWRAVVLIAALHLLVLSVGMVALAHRLRLRPPAGFVAAVALIGSGLVAGKTLQYPQITVIAGIPWLLLTIDLVLDHPVRPRRAIAWLALATAFLCVSGHPQMTFLAFALGAAWTLSRVLRHNTARDLWRVAAGLALGGALAAVQLLPTLALLSGAVERMSASITDPAYVLHRELLPVTLLGDVWAPRTDVLSGTFESMSYVGAAAAAIALFGVVDTLRRRRERAATIVLLLTGAVAIWLSQGTASPLYRLARDVVPLFKEARVPARWIVVVTILVAVLAAQGTDAIVARRVDRRALVAAGAVLLGALLVVLIGPFELPAGKAVATWCIAIAVVVLAVALIGSAPRSWALVGVGLLVAIITIELGLMARHGPLRAASVPAAITSTSDATVRFLQAHPERVISMTQDRFDDARYMITGLRPNVNASFDIRAIDGYDGGPQVRKTWVQVANALTKGHVDPALTLRAGATIPLDPDLYARFGVRWALVDTSVVVASQFVPGWGAPVSGSGTVHLFDNPSYRGDAFLYHATRRVIRNPGKVLRGMDATDLRTVALVGPAGPRLQCSVACDPQAPKVRRVTPEHLVVHTGSGRSGLLAVTEQVDDGWHATVDGHSATITTVDGFMLGVRLPPGRHTVEFRYTAPGLHAGIVVTGVAAVLVIGLLVRRRRPADEARDEHPDC